MLISQSQDGSYVNIINRAVKSNNGKLTIVTGKTKDIDSDVEIIESQKYDSTSLKIRLKTWIAFLNGAQKFLKKHADEYDIIMFTSNPPINQLMVKYALRNRKKCIYLVWDIYPDTIENMFGKKVYPVTYFWRKINHFIYKKCDAVLTIGDVMKRVLQKNYPSMDFEVIPYHADTEFIRPIPRQENMFSLEHNLVDKIVFMYSGKMGAGHGFREILEVAKLLEERSDIKFVLIGFGSSFELVEEQVKQMKLENVLMLPYQPFEMLPYTLGCADVSFITIKEETDGLFLPSKVYDAMASKSAIVCISGGNNDVADMVDRGHIGVQVKTNDVECLKSAILKLADDKEYLASCQENARNLALEKYSIEKVTEAYTEFFGRILRKQFGE